MVTGTPGSGTRFFGSTAQTARLMLYCLLAVVLMAMDHRGQYVPRLRNLAQYAVEPIYHVVDWPARAAQDLAGLFQSRRLLREENEGLRRQLLDQQGQLQQLDMLSEENKRLRALFEGAQKQPFPFQFAELLHVALDPFSHQVLIDRGARDGVQPGQAVIDGQGVMGQVESVQLHYSTVRLISDPSHALPVQISRSGLRTIAFGMGETHRLSLPNVPREADVREGDLVLTSGLGSRFPGGYPVARITTIDREEGRTFAWVEAEPLAALDRGREVLLIEVPATPLQAPAEAPPDSSGERGQTTPGPESSGPETTAATDAESPVPEP